MSAPLMIDLFCGLGGGTEGALAEGYECIGFDIERHQYAVTESHFGGLPKTRILRYPGKLVLQDALTIHGKQLRDAAYIWASPPCQEFSYMAMPWKRGKQIAAALRGRGEFPDGYTGSRTIAQLTALFDACFRIQREACEAAGRYIPMVVENVKGAQPWVGKAKANFGSFYLWGDVAMVGNRVVSSVPTFGQWTRPIRAEKKGRSNFHFYDQTGLPSPSFHGAEHEPAVQRHAAIKNSGGSRFNVAHNTESGLANNPVSVPAGRKISEYSDPRRNGGKGVHMTSPRENDSGTKQGGDWFNAEQPSISRMYSSKSDSRKAASAQIAKIPFDLSIYIARAYKPRA